MKRIMSFLILLAILFLGLEFLVTLFTKEYVVNYTIYSNKKEIKVKENYSKDKGNVYDVEISIGNSNFYYIINNNFNKQKRIIKDIVYYEDNEDICIYPILNDDSGSYIECIKDNNLYTKDTYPNRNLVNMISSDLDSRGYRLTYHEDFNNKFGNSTVYQKNIVNGDTVLVWQYKGINIFSNSDLSGINVLGFDKYDNKLGILVGKYYVIPQYKNNKVLEFNSIEIVNVENGKSETIDLKDYTLSSGTYVNGIVNGKLYYTDPYNLLQVEVNIGSKSVRLLGSKEIGGQMYDGEKWSDRNIYDFKQEIKFGKNVTLENYPNTKIYEGKGVYYVYDNNRNMYVVPKNHVDKKVLIFNANINNINVVDNELYYVIGDTLYYYSMDKGTIKILVDKDLTYNTGNRISIYRKNS